MNINVSKWLQNLSKVILVVGFVASISVSSLPMFIQTEFYVIFWAVIVPIWVISFILFTLLHAIKAHLEIQKSILERLNQSFKVEEQRRIEDPLSRF